MEIPAINLKAIVLVHWLLTVWSCIAMGFAFSGYVWSNFTVLALGVWAIAQRDSVDAVLMFLLGMVLTIVTDIVHVALAYPSLINGNTLANVDTLRFSVGMAIFNLILKPLSCFFVYQMYRERGGDYNINFGFPTVTRNRDAYQSIDQQDQPAASAKPFGHEADQKPRDRLY